MKKIYVLLIGMVTLFFADKSYGQDEDYTRRWTISVIESYVEIFKEMSEPVIFKDDFIGSNDLHNSIEEKNFIKMKPIVPDVSEKKIEGLESLLLDKLNTSIATGFPHGAVFFTSFQRYLNDVLGIVHQDFEYNPIFAAKIYPKSAVFFDDSCISDSDSFSSKELILDKYGIVSSRGFLVLEDTTKLSIIEKTIWNREFSYDKEIIVMSSKPIKSFQYEVRVPIPSTKILKLSKEEPVKTLIHGDFKLMRVNGDKVRIEIDPFLYRTVDIYGINKDGQALKEIRREKKFKYTDKQKVLFRKYLEEAEAVLKDVNLHANYSSADISNIISDLDFYGKRSEHKPLKKSYEIEFSGPVDHIQINVYGILDEPKVFSFEEVNDYPDEEFFLSTDNFLEKVGLVGIDGQWIVKPMFSRDISFANKYFYYELVKEIDNEEEVLKTYWLDRKNKKVKKIDSREYGRKVYNDQYFIMVKGLNRPQGVMDVISGEMVLPVKYDYIRFEEDKWKVRLDEQEYYFTLDGKAIKDDSE